MVISLLFRCSPQAARFLLLDPKGVELTAYRGVPHLAHPVITYEIQSVAALTWAAQEADRRRRLFGSTRVRELSQFNQVSPDPLPRLVLVIDDLAPIWARQRAVSHTRVLNISVRRSRLVNRIEPRC